MLDFDPRLVRDIKLAENCELTAYKDSVGLWTVGWGHRLYAGPLQTDTWDGYTITQQQADNLLQGDITYADAFATHLREWPSLDTLCRQNAVVELCFNMRGRWLGFVDTRAAIMKKDWQAAHDGLLDSKWATQVKEKRANRIANYLLDGHYP